MKALNTEIHHFCPRKSCPHHKSINNTITKYGTYTTKGDSVPRQMFYCGEGKHQFSETGYSYIWGKHGSFKEYMQAAKLFAYGLNNEKIGDVLEKDERTIVAWSEAIGKKSMSFHLWICSVVGLKIKFLQMDELWSYVNGKSNQLWVFASMDVPTRFWIGFACGKRTIATAKRLVAQVHRLGKWSKGSLLRITTDKLAAYRHAIEYYFGKVNYVYLQIVKQRIKRVLKTVKKAFIKGNTSDFPGKTQNTSFIERFNLTLRQRVSYLCRKTLGYCKNAKSFDCVLAINLFNYNYCRSHKSLRIRLIEDTKKKFSKIYSMSTPAMKMGLTNEQLTWRFLLITPILEG